ncbi:hypothetical protein [Cupriavidus agavae]|uniref:Uncharacterized protein n=1 Tax=Cupriavidus agavae TaxID=1001822 RepID=A0A4Q7RWQ0_9BURK|nr:hypothetical protein [Cupriavidus agavae]RZT38386.1 hypothetical protein EV147_2852 [Cupriavidus agavae]
MQYDAKAVANFFLDLADPANAKTDAEASVFMFWWPGTESNRRHKDFQNR